MKRLFRGALALLAALAVVACAPPTGGGGGGGNDSGSWKIKGSFDNWVLHTLSADEIDQSQLTWEATDLYAIDYEFVLVNPSGTEIKYSSDDNVSASEPFTMGGSHNASFTAEKSSYVIQVDVSTPSAPVVTLVPGASSALAVTNAVLLSKLKIKGDQFHEIDGVAKDSWVATSGTEGSDTESWDVLVDVKNGSFGFDVLEGWVAKVDIDASGLVAENDVSDDYQLLAEGGTGGNVHLVDTVKDGSVYRITVTVDVTKTVAEGRYMVKAELITLGTEDWAFEAPTSIFLNGDVNAAGWVNTLAHDEVELVDGVASFTYTATATATVGFKYYTTNAASWDGMVGIGGVDGSGSTITVGGSDNIEFAVEDGVTYTITLDFSGTYVSTGKPEVNVEEAP